MYRGNNIFSFSNNRSEIRRRTWTVMVIFILLLCLLIWRIANYMYFKSEPLKTMFNAQYTIDEQYGLQYDLLDRNGIPLLDYAVNYYAIIDPVDYVRFNQYTSKYDLELLNITLRNYNNKYDLKELNNALKKYNIKPDLSDINDIDIEKIRYKIDEVTYDKLKDIKGVKGFYTFASNDVIKDRYWKIENLLINTTYNKVVFNSYKDYYKKVVGASGNQGYYKKVVPVYKSVLKSADSLEMQIYNKTKNNEYTKIRFAKGVNGEIGEGKIIEPVTNVNVRLTLEKGIQDKVEAILQEEEYKKYDQIGVVLMESSNGKIRAMAQKDDNAYNANLGMPTTNGALPGSIFKVIVDEAGIDMGSIDNEKTYTIDPEIFKEEHNKGNSFTVAEALAKSSNNIFAQLGWNVGFKNIYNYAEKQGMLGKVLNLQQEDLGKFDENSSNITPANTSQTAIGQNVYITPLEALSIPNTIVNNGVYVQPSLIDAYVDDNNNVLERITSKTTTVLKKETAETVKLHMMDVVNKGTGDAAYIKGMDIGGKTGTTTYENGNKSDGWFVGFFSLKGKNYSMVVFVNNVEMNVKGVADEEGGGTAAPIFKKVVNAFKSID